MFEPMYLHPARKSYLPCWPNVMRCRGRERRAYKIKTNLTKYRAGVVRRKIVKWGQDYLYQCELMLERNEMQAVAEFRRTLFARVEAVFEQQEPGRVTMAVLESGGELRLTNAELPGITVELDTHTVDNICLTVSPIEGITHLWFRKTLLVPGSPTVTLSVYCHSKADTRENTEVISNSGASSPVDIGSEHESVVNMEELAQLIGQPMEFDTLMTGPVLVPEPMEFDTLMTGPVLVPESEDGDGDYTTTIPEDLLVQMTLDPRDDVDPYLVEFSKTSAGSDASLVHYCQFHHFEHLMLVLGVLLDVPIH